MGVKLLISKFEDSNKEQEPTKTQREVAVSKLSETQKKPLESHPSTFGLITHPFPDITRYTIKSQPDLVIKFERENDVKRNALPKRSPEQFTLSSNKFKNGHDSCNDKGSHMLSVSKAAEGITLSEQMDTTVQHVEHKNSGSETNSQHIENKINTDALHNGHKRSNSSVFSETKPAKGSTKLAIETRLPLKEKEHIEEKLPFCEQSFEQLLNEKRVQHEQMCHKFHNEQLPRNFHHEQLPRTSQHQKHPPDSNVPLYGKLLTSKYSPIRVNSGHQFLHRTLSDYLQEESPNVIEDIRQEHSPSHQRNLSSHKSQPSIYDDDIFETFSDSAAVSNPLPCTFHEKKPEFCEPTVETPESSAIKPEIYEFQQSEFPHPVVAARIEDTLSVEQTEKRRSIFDFLLCGRKLANILSRRSRRAAKKNGCENEKTNSEHPFAARKFRIHELEPERKPSENHRLLSQESNTYDCDQNVEAASEKKPTEKSIVSNRIMPPGNHTPREIQKTRFGTVFGTSLAEGSVSNTSGAQRSQSVSQRNQTPSRTQDYTPSSSPTSPRELFTTSPLSNSLSNVLAKRRSKRDCLLTKRESQRSICSSMIGYPEYTENNKFQGKFKPPRASPIPNEQISKFNSNHIPDESSMSSVDNGKGYTVYALNDGETTFDGLDTLEVDLKDLSTFDTKTSILDRNPAKVVRPEPSIKEEFTSRGDMTAYYHELPISLENHYQMANLNPQSQSLLNWTLTLDDLTDELLHGIENWNYELLEPLIDDTSSEDFEPLPPITFEPLEKTLKTAVTPLIADFAVYVEKAFA